MRTARVGSVIVAGILLASAAASEALLPLQSLVGAGYLEVTLDTSRFRQDGVATIRIVNLFGFRVDGEIPACLTVFEPKDARFSPLAPRETGRFTVGPGQTIQVTRPFRPLEPSKRVPDGGAYELSEHPLLHDLSNCRG